MTSLYGSKKSFMKEPKKLSCAQVFCFFFFNPKSMIKQAGTDVKSGTQLPRPVGWHLA